MIANIAHKKMQNVADLSGGEKQRCAIARAIVMTLPLFWPMNPLQIWMRKIAFYFLR